MSRKTAKRSKAVFNQLPSSSASPLVPSSAATEGAAPVCESGNDEGGGEITTPVAYAALPPLAWRGDLCGRRDEDRGGGQEDEDDDDEEKEEEEEGEEEEEEEEEEEDDDDDKEVGVRLVDDEGRRRRRVDDVLVLTEDAAARNSSWETSPPLLSSEIEASVPFSSSMRTAAVLGLLRFFEDFLGGGAPRFRAGF